MIPPAVAAIVLAAGRGTRFGPAPKLLASLDGKPLVRHAVEAACHAAVSPVLVVTGHRASEIEAAVVDLPIRVVPNSAYADGLSTSLQAGFAALPGGCQAAIVLLGDMPRVDAALVDRLIAAWEEAGRPAAVVPTHAGRRGNPVLLSRILAPGIAHLTGDTGAGPLLRGRADVLEFPTESGAVTLDIDTAPALERLGAGGQAPASTTPSRIAE